jgi:ketosteroid isomerase-like protein
MKSFFALCIAAGAGLFSCTNTDRQSKTEILQAEKDFAAMAKEKGVATAFYTFADTNAVIKRGNQLVKGKGSIKEFYFQQLQKGDLQWTPEFVDASGELGYTYGPFTYSEKDSTGKAIETKGFFHTVWRKQKDGKWKFVWD